MFDLIIRNGLICDGSGAPAFKGDVAVRDGKIAALGEVTGDAKQVIDAKGQVVAPGFIDPHTHFDAQLLWDGYAQPSLEHGITTVMSGNCSLSLAPLKAQDRDLLGATFRQIEEMPKAAFDAGISWTWESFDDYVKAIKDGLGINVAPLVGHSLLRMWVMGAERSRNHAATPDEVKQMQALLKQCLDAGSIGMSGSWVDIDHERHPVPARLAEHSELEALCETLGENNAILQMVPEFWDADILRVRIDQLADISRKYNISTTFSPLFDSNAWPNLVYLAMDRIRLQTAHGARVTPQMQVRPIDLSFDLTQPNSTFATLPGWWAATIMPVDEKRAKLKDPELRKSLCTQLESFMQPIGLQIDFRDAYVKRMGKPDAKLMNRSMRDIAAERNCHFGEAIIDLALEHDFDISFGLDAIGHNNSPKIGQLMLDPLVGLGAGDGGAHVSNFATYGDTSLLFSEYVRKQHALPLEYAVRKLTHDIATVWNVKNRGLLRPGYAADIVIFDANTMDRGVEVPVDDLPASGWRYVRRNTGVKTVFVNGALAYDLDAGYSDKKAGAVTERVAA